MLSAKQADATVSAGYFAGSPLMTHNRYGNCCERERISDDVSKTKLSTASVVHCVVVFLK